jgi:hypothetical protein
VSLACNPIDFSGLTLTAGAVNTGTHSWFVTGPISAAPGLNLGNIEIDGQGVTVVGPSLQAANVTFAAATDAFRATSGTLYVSGNWDESAAGYFLASGGTVEFNGTGTQTINTGDTSTTSTGRAFNNLTIDAGSTLSLQSNVLVVGTFSDNGTLTTNGYKIIT